MPTLVLIVGPIASGKSTIAAEVARRLRAEGQTIALIGLDAVADTIDRADWDAAHSVLGNLVAAWLRRGINVVCEGPSTTHEVELVTSCAPDDTTITTVRLGIDLPVAHARALTDPTRGISRDLDFLTGDHDRHRSGISGLDVDLVIDTRTTTASAAGEQIIGWLNSPGMAG